MQIEWVYQFDVCVYENGHYFCMRLRAYKRTQWHMITSWNGNIFLVTGHLRGEFTGPQWIPRTKTSDAELWCFIWSAPE